MRDELGYLLGATAMILVMIIVVFLITSEPSLCKPHAKGETSVLWFTSYSSNDIDAKMHYWFKAVNKTGKIRDVCLNSVNPDKLCDIDLNLQHNYITYFDPLTNTTFVKDENEWKMKHKYDYLIVEKFGLEDRHDTPIIWDCDKEAFISWETGEI